MQDELPLGVPPRQVRYVPTHNEPDRARFAAKTREDPDGCLTWTGAISTDGYGRFWLPQDDGRQRVVVAHIFAWECAQPAGTEHDPQVVRMHECNNTLCVRIAPGHVTTGTQRANIADADTLGRRQGRRPVRGETRRDEALRRRSLPPSNSSCDYPQQALF